MASAEGGSVPNGVGYGEECPLSSRLEGLGERRELPQRGSRGRAPVENGFWRILKATERSFLYLYDKNLRDTICTSVPRPTRSKCWGLIVPASLMNRDLRPRYSALSLNDADHKTTLLNSSYNTLLPEN